MAPTREHQEPGKGILSGALEKITDPVKKALSALKEQIAKNTERLKDGVPFDMDKALKEIGREYQKAGRESEWTAEAKSRVYGGLLQALKAAGAPTEYLETDEFKKLQGFVDGAVQEGVAKADKTPANRNRFMAKIEGFLEGILPGGKNMLKDAVMALIGLGLIDAKKEDGIGRTLIAFFGITPEDLGQKPPAPAPTPAPAVTATAEPVGDRKEIDIYDWYGVKKQMPEETIKGAVALLREKGIIKETTDLTSLTERASKQDSHFMKVREVMIKRNSGSISVFTLQDVAYLQALGEQQPDLLAKIITAATRTDNLTSLPATPNGIREFLDELLKSGGLDPTKFNAAIAKYETPATTVAAAEKK